MPGGALVFSMKEPDSVADLRQMAGRGVRTFDGIGNIWICARSNSKIATAAHDEIEERLTLGEHFLTINDTMKAKICAEHRDLIVEIDNETDAEAVTHILNSGHELVWADEDDDKDDPANLNFKKLQSSLPKIRKNMADY